MIQDALTFIVKALLSSLIALMPSYTPPKSVDMSAFAAIAWLIPISEIQVLVAAVVAVVVASLSWVAVNWLINKANHSG